jgi:hypothetical protein
MDCSSWSRRSSPAGIRLLVLVFRPGMRRREGGVPMGAWVLAVDIGATSVTAAVRDGDRVEAVEFAGPCGARIRECGFYLRIFVAARGMSGGGLVLVCEAVKDLLSADPMLG